METRATTRRTRCESSGRRLLARWLVGSIVVATVLASAGGAPRVMAADADTMITIGESNTPAQVDELLAYFGADDSNAVVTVSVADTFAAMDGIYDLTGVDTAYSSTAFTCGEPGDGITVTTRNIEAVTPGLYAMALITAGVDDGVLVVAAPDDAPALGMTALTGVFQTWDAAGCGAGAMDSRRQQLALEQLALVVRIGQSFGTPDGIDLATRIALAAQQDLIATGATDPDDIDASVAAQEAAEGATILPGVRAELLDLLGRIGAADLDWATFAAGWTANGVDDGVGIRLTGIAVGGMVETAAATSTVAATATSAPSTPSSTATRVPPTPAPPKPTATAPAPTATVAATPSPTATPAAVMVSGTFTDSGGDGGVALAGVGGGDPMVYPVDSTLAVFRAGAAAEIADLVPGDTIQVTYDPTSGRATRIDAQPGLVATSDARSGWLRWLVAAGVLAVLLVAGVLLFGRRRRRQVNAPVVVTVPVMPGVEAVGAAPLAPRLGLKHRLVPTLATLPKLRLMARSVRRASLVLRSR